MILFEEKFTELVQSNETIQTGENSIVCWLFVPNGQQIGIHVLGESLHSYEVFGFAKKLAQRVWFLMDETSCFVNF